MKRVIGAALLAAGLAGVLTAPAAPQEATIYLAATKIDNPSNGNPPPGLTKDKPDNPHFNPGGTGGGGGGA